MRAPAFLSLLILVLLLAPGALAERTFTGVYAAVELPPNGLPAGTCSHEPAPPGVIAGAWSCFVLSGAASVTIATHDALPGATGFRVLLWFVGDGHEDLGMVWESSCGPRTFEVPEGTRRISVGVAPAAQDACPTAPTAGIVTVTAR